MNTGWICPRCQKVHAPDVRGCECEPLPDLIGKPYAPIKTTRAWPTVQAVPMPICGCTGPCGNAACPHMGQINCRVATATGFPASSNI